MKVTINNSELTAALARLKTVVAKKASLPILSGVLIDATGDSSKVRLLGTDLDNYLALTIPAEVKEPGEVVANCTRLQRLLTDLDGETVTIAADHKHIINARSNGTMRFDLFGLAPDEMPEPPTLNLQQMRAQHFAAGVLAAAFDREIGSASEDQTRYALCGVYITKVDGEVAMVATDGRRLAFTEIHSERNADPGLDVIIPTAACQHLKCLDDGGATLLRVSDTQIEASGESWTLTAKRIEGNYPNWKQVVPPKGAPNTFTIGREKLSDAIHFASAVCTENASGVKLTLTRSNTVRVAGNSPDVGGTEAVVDAKVTLAGAEIAAGFNPGFLLEALATMEAAEVTGELADEFSPLRLTDGVTVHVVMPMRVA